MGLNHTCLDTGRPDKESMLCTLFMNLGLVCPAACITSIAIGCFANNNLKPHTLKRWLELFFLHVVLRKQGVCQFV